MLRPSAVRPPASGSRLSRSDLVGYGESCPRPYVTGETTESARAFFADHHESLCREVVDLESLREWMATHTAAIDSNPAAWCAVELALLDLIGKSTGQTVESLLSLPALAGPFRYTAVLGDSSEAAFTATAQGYRRMGFTDFKVKLSGDLERDTRKLAILDGLDSESSRTRRRQQPVARRRRRGRAPGTPGTIALPAVEEPLTARKYAGLVECRQRSVVQSFLTRASCRLTSSTFSKARPSGGWSTFESRRWVVCCGRSRSFRLVALAASLSSSAPRSAKRACSRALHLPSRKLLARICSHRKEHSERSCWSTTCANRR